MDMDIIEDQDQFMGLSKPSAKRTQVVLVDDAHPLEIEAYISGYTGRAYVERLLFIITVCPSLAPQAFTLAVQEALKMRDTNLYRHIFTAYEQAHAKLEGAIPEPSELGTIDQKWVEETNTRNHADRTKLEVELKTYTSNMIKESIRMGHRDLGNFYRAVGDTGAALKHYTKSREFCTTSQHMLDMCLSVLELLVEQRNYSHISTYVFKAEHAVEATTNLRPTDQAAAGAAAAAATSTPAANQASKDKKAADRERVQSKLDVATGLSHLGQSHYEKAAQAFLKVGPLKGLEEWSGKIIAPSDIAIYAVLCALATFSRAEIRARVLGNDNFGVYIEQEPYVRELLESFMGNRFRSVLELLDRYSTRHAIDIHLAPHIVNLTNLIRSKALVLYFQPFSSIKLERMSQAFGWSMEELEQQVVSLIQAGEIKARVDRQNKILKAKDTDQRAALFAKATKVGADMQAANRKLLLRMRLQQADLVVKAPKGGHGHAHTQQQHFADLMNESSF